MLKVTFFLAAIFLCLAVGVLINEPSHLSAFALFGWTSATTAWLIIMRELKYE